MIGGDMMNGGCCSVYLFNNPGEISICVGASHLIPNWGLDRGWDIEETNHKLSKTWL